MFSTSARKTASAVSVLYLTSLAVNVYAAPSGYMELSDALVERAAQSYSGCYSSSTGLTEFGTYQWQSTGYCGGNCTSLSKAVLGLTNGNDCWCGGELPPASSKVDDSKCNVGCAGYGTVMCGGDNFWSVYLTGLDDNVPNAASSGSTSSGSSSSTSTSGSSATSTASSASTTTPAVVTSVAPGTTVVVTQPADHSPTTGASTSDKSTSHHSSNTAGIAAGVVVGVVAFAAIVAGVYFFLRRRQRRLAEEDYQRSTQVQNFMRSTNRPPGTSYSAASDQRLDPVAGRRNSVGSLADNQDYSRRILRVANPDGY